MTTESNQSPTPESIFDIDNKVVLVTGASSGIGLHLCQMLLGRGCRVVGASRTACESDALRIIDKQYSGNFLAVNMDVSSISIDMRFSHINISFLFIDPIFRNSIFFSITDQI